MSQAQCIVCKCGCVIAACISPECYQEESWMKDVRDYSIKGYKIEMRNCGMIWPVTVNRCKCNENKNQLTLPV